MGPIAMMLMDHERSREIAKRMELSTKQYLELGNSENLISDMNEYVQHITEHLWKENNCLFMMAETRLQCVADKVDSELNEMEKTKLQEIGTNRSYYEKLAENLSKEVCDQNN